MGGRAFNRLWLVKYDIFYRLMLPIFALLTLGLAITAYSAQSIYMGYYVAQGITGVVIGSLILAFAIFLIVLGASYRTIYTAAGITRIIFSHKVQYKWKSLAQIHLIDRGGRRYFYFLLNRMPPETVLMSRLRQQMIVAQADDEVARMVLKNYRKPVRNFKTRRKFKGFPHKIKGEDTIVCRVVLKKRLLLCLAAGIVLFAGLGALLSAQALPMQAFLAALLLLLAATAISIRLNILTYFFNSNGCYVKSFVTLGAIHKFEIKSYGIYTHKNECGVAKSKHIFISRLRMQTHEVQYHYFHQSACRRFFLCVPLNTQIFALLKSYLPYEPQRVARRFD